DCPRLHCAGKPPIVLFFCCYTGALTNNEGCIATDLLRSADGPVAVIGGSSETMPYGMSAMGRQAIREYFDNRSPTLGDWLLAAKRDTMAGYDLPIWSLVNAATIALAPAFVNPKAERFDHLQMFNLFGDPTMALYHPRELKFNVPSPIVAGDKLKIEAPCPIDGAVTVELLVPMDRLPSPGRAWYDGSPRGRAEFDATYQASNQSRIASATAQAHDRRLSVDLSVPPDASGIYRVRIFVEGQTSCAVGASDLLVTSPTNHPASTQSGSTPTPENLKPARYNATNRP
ncbi:MAG TPA: C25 family cysteine peptidase, partial [Pirellulales bacterium]